MVSGSSSLVDYAAVVSGGEEGVGAAVKREYIENGLFLDLDSLSKSFQTILKTYQMLVIAQVKQITSEVACPQSNPYNLPL